ncbi:MAG TPA: type II secretion system F family protein [Candidatus Binatia bacterium]|jgi:type IV pilus assembly protein PilC|nr:type II secretion system F family protein [Candidatus Binatia bacterium]
MLTVTPGQFRQRSEFYHQLGLLTGAGIGLIRGLEQLQRNPPARSYRQPITQVLGRLAEGCTLTESLRQLDSWLPAFDIALLHAGEQSGRMDACFHLLANYYEDRARIARQLIADLAYPAFLFHFGVLIFAFLPFFRTGDWVTFLAQTLGVFLAIYAVIGLLIYAGQSRHGENWRGWVESVLHPIPVLGTARWYLALARLAAALEALLSAGINVIEAWEMAATASGSPALRRAVLAWRPRVAAGQTPAEVVSASRRFPPLFANQYATGEISGQLDATLQRLHQYYQDEGSRKLRAVSRWVPMAIYLSIVLLIAYRIIQFYLGYFQQVQNAAGF